LGGPIGIILVELWYLRLFAKDSSTVSTNTLAWKWDSTLIGTGIEVTADKTKVFLKEGPYMFRTCIGDTVRKNNVAYI
jgi:hypothetical protein